ncbi:hypothetical protein RI367_007724 [Sorochytrium milnesiophthora]
MTATIKELAGGSLNNTSPSIERLVKSYLEKRHSYHAQVFANFDEHRFDDLPPFTWDALPFPRAVDYDPEFPSPSPATHTSA